MGASKPTNEIGAGAVVRISRDQRFADGTTIAAGERGRILYHSSQAACWIVLFPERGTRKVIAGANLELVDG